jgi:pSer/pThr/pTyr-binding forkhead associated (FHA) protein
MSQTPRSSDSAVTVSWSTAGTVRCVRLTEPFCIGRDAHGELQTEEAAISHAQAAVFLREGQWWVRNLDSTDGALLNGAPFQSARLARRGILAFSGIDVQVMLEIEEQPTAGQDDPTAGPPSDPNADRTKLQSAAVPDASANAGSTVQPIRIRVDPDTHPREFTDTIRIGRDAASAIRIDDEGVSRAHVEIFRVSNHWFARDLGSRNGTFLDGQRIDDALLPSRCTLSLGVDGPRLELSYVTPQRTESASPRGPRSLEEVAAHYFDPDSKAPAGDRTMWVRRAYSTVQRRQKRRYGSVIAGAIGLLLVAVGIGVYQHLQLQRTRSVAEQIFYNMKTIELQLAQLETQVQASTDPTHRGDADQARARLAEMSSQYDVLLEELGILNDETLPEDRLIFRMARVFGECEIAMPEGFVEETKRYIDIWRADERLAKALRRAHEQNLPPVITRTLAEHHMPPQFFYVALQESDFLPRAIGPQTRFGIAKGMWQIMPETAIQYGLRPGPLLDVPEFDPADERFDAAAATGAAARYLADLYRGEAQASGLLVLASYNWGTTRVRKRIQAMEENPRDRNFWRLLAQTDMPAETRDYVFKIFSAAVIGEDPKLFGFDFEKPLGHGQPAPKGS